MLVLSSNQRRCNFSRKGIPSHDRQPSRSSDVVANILPSGKAVRQRNRSANCLPPCGMSRMTSSIRDLPTWKVRHPPPLLIGHMPESIWWIKPQASLFRFSGSLVTNVPLRLESWTKRSFQEPSKKNSSCWPAKERQTPMQDNGCADVFV